MKAPEQASAALPAIAATVRIPVRVDTPRHAAMAATLDYLCERPLAAGTMVRVPLGRREVWGVVWPEPAAVVGEQEAGAVSAASGPSPSGDAATGPTLRPVREALDLPPLGEAWRSLVDFAARYYQRSAGEVAAAAVPPELRALTGVALQRRLTRLHKREAQPGAAEASDPPVSTEAPPALQAEQADAVAALLRALAEPEGQPAAWLLHGVTGSGKTEVYLRAAEAALQAGRQVLLLVPEINLTPQFEARLRERFAQRRLVSMHSGLTPAQRLQSWLQAHLGLADLVLGTRLAVWASLPRLGLVVVDEEHDPSYKQQEGARYSARDLAVARGRLEGVPVVLGSATPSLETWLNAEVGRYRRLPLSRRIGDGAMPRVRLVDMGQLDAGRRSPSGPQGGLSPALLAAMQQRIDAGEQSLVLLNRRGYAPVLHCGDCGWKSGCPHCSAWRVFHKGDRTLRCHHCGLTEPVPRACPDCGNPDISPVGRGTERLEEQLAALLRGRDGGAVRLARIDADSARGSGQLAAQLAQVHSGDVEVLVGTQMVTKGHDFRRITLVAAVNPDGALFSSDFRAGERLFALLMQAGGRAGRDAAQAGRSELWIQTFHPTHPIFKALVRHDFEAFAAQQLDERRSAGLPPYSHLALLRSEARSLDAARDFLAEASRLLRDDPAFAAALQAVTLYPPVPMPMVKVAGIERAQLLVESSSRGALQRLLGGWLPLLDALRAQHRGVLRWAVDVDPLAL